MRLVTVMNGDDELQTAGAGPNEGVLASDGSAESVVEATLDLPVHGDTPVSTPAPTRMVGERFALVRKIGEGAFGLVYEAEDRVDGGRVALKLLRQLGPEWPDRFKREFRSLRDLDHPHVVQLFELFFLDGRWCFTMELLDGVHLVAHLRDPSRGQVVDPKRVRTAFAQLASALAALHALGKVHRDVKPSNVFVTREGRVVLLDFGLVTDVAVRELTHRSRIVGTPSYMAPEQATQGEIGPPADMYAMGVMLYEVLTGKPPFSGDPRWVLLDKLSARPVSMPEFGPEDLAALAVSLLQPSPEARPTAVAVLEQLARGAPDDLERVPVSLLRPPSSPHFVGRQAELAALEGAFDLARGRSAVIASVRGPSGIGKTALVGRFVDRLRDEGAALVFSSRCYEREAVPFKAFDELADQLVRHLLTLPEGDSARVLASESSALQRMFPVFSIMQASLEDVEEEVDPREMRQQAFSAFAAILARLGAARPLVLWIDDAQWGDADSAEILLSVLPPAGPASLLVALAHRLIDGAPGGFLDAMAARTPAEILRFDVALKALTPEDVRALVSQTIDADPSAEDWAEVVARETEGNPFFVKELARFLRDRPASAADFARASSNHSLEDMILERVGRLPPGARRLLEVVALAGVPISRRAAFLASGLGPEAHASLAALRTGRLLQTRGPGAFDLLSGCHDRISETIVQSLGPAERQPRHRAIAQALDGLGDCDPEVLVYHHREAGDVARAAVHAVRAAKQAVSSLAFERAVRLYRVALELGSFADAEREEHEIALGDALANAGHGKEAADVYLALAARAPRDIAVEMQRRAGEQLMRSGYVDEGFDLVGSVLRAHDVHLPSTPGGTLLSLVLRRAFIRVRGYRFTPRDAALVPAALLQRLDAIWSARLASGVIDMVPGAELQARYVQLALKVGEPLRVAMAVGVELAHVASQGTAARPAFERLRVLAITHAASVRSPAVTALVAMSDGMATCCMGEFRRAVECCDRAEHIFRHECPGTGWEIATARIFAHLSLALLGDLNELRQRKAVHAQESRDRSDRYAAWIHLSSYSVLPELAADRPAELLRELDDALAHWSKTRFTLQHHWASIAMALVDLYRGEGARGAARLAETERRHVAAQLLRVEAVRINFRVTQIRCLLAAGGHDAENVRRAASLVGALRRERVGWASPIADMTAAAVCWSRRDEDQAARLLTRAAEGFDTFEMNLLAVAVRWHLGHLVGGDHGKSLVSRSEEAMKAQKILRPASFARAVAPSFRVF
jgi:hypothetical protein